MAGPFTRLQPPPNRAKYSNDTLYVADLDRWFALIQKILGTVDGGIGWMIINQAEATEGVQDIVGAFAQDETTDSAKVGVKWVYSDVNGTLKANVTVEDIQDLVAAYISAPASNALTVTYDDTANTLTFSVAKAAASTDAAASAVAVTSPDATDLATVITLANELKLDLNSLVTDVNVIKSSLNDLKSKLRTANLLIT